jgi:ketosteroid isomerase-like protein
MQSTSTLNMLANLDRTFLEQRTRAHFAALGRGDIRSVLTGMAETVVYEVAGAWDVYPRHARREGIEATREMLLHLNREFETQGSTLQDIMIDGEKVATRRVVRLRHRGTNAVGDVTIIGFLRFRDGLLIEVADYPDTAMIERLTGRIDAN